MLEQIIDNKNILAIIIRNNYSNNGINFFTPNDFSQQLAYMRHQKGYSIQPHFHNALKREILNTQEVLIVKCGKIKVNFFNIEQKLINTCILETGDIILLASGGHGFEMLENTELIEIKQGPYLGEKDKTRFSPKSENEEII